jgi:hypothetical protein
VRAGTLQPFMAGPADRLVRRALRSVFSTEGAAGGSPWAPRRASTVAIYRQSGEPFGRKVGRRSGALATAAGTVGADGSAVTATDRGYTLALALRSPGGAPYPVYFAGGYTLRSVFGRPLRRARRVPARRIAPRPGSPAAVDLGRGLAAALVTYLQTGRAR